MNKASDYESELGVNRGSLRIESVIGEVSVVRVDTSEKIVTKCSLWALRCVCTRRGLDSVISAGIDALAVNQRTAAHAQWNYAGDKLSRSDTLVKQIRGWIGYNQRQMDALFSAAVAVEELR